jgi:ABC-type polysaccharide/polyol phosphate export permease
MPFMLPPASPMSAASATAALTRVEALATAACVLRPIRELVRYRALLEYLVLLDLRVRYRGSVLGFLWTLLNPLLLMLVMWAVFSRVVRLDEDNYALFLLSGLMGWLFFQQSIDQSLTTIVRNKGLIQKIYLPKIVFPISVVASNLVNLAFFLVAYFLVALPTAHGIPWTATLIVPVLGMLFLMSAGLSLIISALTVFFRDLTHLTSVILRALFYATPIFYRPEVLGSTGHFALKLNPAYYPVIAMRDVLYSGKVPSLEVWAGGYGMGVALVLLGLVIFTNTEDRFVYYA